MGLVVKHAGVVAKGFAILLGIMLTATLEVFVDGNPLSTNKLIAIPIVILSTILHIKFPPKKSKPMVRGKKGNRVRMGKGVSTGGALAFVFPSPPNPNNTLIAVCISQEPLRTKPAGKQH